MNQRQTSPRRLSTCVLTGLLLTASACGGGSEETQADDSEVAVGGSVAPIDPTTTQTPPTASPATDPPATEPPATEPPVTDPPVTEPPVTDPPVTEPPATEATASQTPRGLDAPIELGDDDMASKLQERAAMDLSGATEVTDVDGRIDLFVPSGWTDVRSVPDSAASQLAVSTDVDRFFGSLDQPGVLVQLDDVASGTGTATSAEEAQAISETIGNGSCVQRDVEFYVDGSMLGGEIVLDCVEGFDTRVFGLAPTGGDDDRSVIVIVINPTGDTSARDLIVETLLIGA